MGTWADQYTALLSQPFGSIVRVAKSAIAHPKDEGAKRSTGLPVGQSGDWRFAPSPSCHGLHVEDFGTEWRAHIDWIHPECDFLGHLIVDVLQHAHYQRKGIAFVGAPCVALDCPQGETIRRVDFDE